MKSRQRRNVSFRCGKKTPELHSGEKPCDQVGTENPIHIVPRVGIKPGSQRLKEWCDHVSNNKVLDCLAWRPCSCKGSSAGLVMWLEWRTAGCPKLWCTVSSCRENKVHVGRPKLCFLDCTKRHLKASGISVQQWEVIASSRKAW